MKLQMQYSTAVGKRRRVRGKRRVEAAPPSMGKVALLFSCTVHKGARPTLGLRMCHTLEETRASYRHHIRKPSHGVSGFQAIYGGDGDTIDI